MVVHGFNGAGRIRPGAERSVPGGDAEGLEPVRNVADGLAQMLSLSDVVVRGPGNLHEFLFRVNDCVEEPVGMAGRAGVIRGVADYQRGYADPCGAALPVGM